MESLKNELNNYALGFSWKENQSPSGSHLYGAFGWEIHHNKKEDNYDVVFINVRRFRGLEADEVVELFRKFDHRQTDI